MTKQQAVRQIIWDYSITPEQFEQMLHDGTPAMLTRDKKWAMTRTLERADYYTAMQLIGVDALRQHWPELRTGIRFNHIKDAYDFVVSR